MIKSMTASITKMEGDGCDKAAEKPLDYSLSCSMKVTGSPNFANDCNIVDNEKITLSGGDSSNPKVLEGNKEIEGSIDINNANSNENDGESSATKILKLRTLQKQEVEGKNVFGNNNVIESNNTLKDKLIWNNYYGDDQNWKSHYYDPNERHVRFPWKRMAYVCVLLVLGITCAILALMKICGGADWMNMGTFAVIIMGGIMLLPPGLYYGRILICICCRCKEYSLWDVPAGPFG
ncbi:hypothetical protein Ocin01_09547 [Orchesella cincta]|uniref:Transmembrane protein n=1 Tax=Orchesella cincta TaxID=48709 RepID=A0A1D2MWG1_ORCCI|nr:hypothetical protein Ocin01_09547 [Orchesella cincta]